MKSHGITTDGEEIRRRRLRKGLLVHELAEQIGVSPGYVSHIENGNRRPSPPVFVALCAALGVAEDNQGELLLSESA